MTGGTGGGGSTLTVSPSSVAAGGSVTGGWSGVASATTTDWVSVYAAGAADTAYTPNGWFYTNSCSQTAGTTTRAGGSCSLTLPASLAAGTYELRLYANGGFTRLATSPSFTVTAP